MNGRRVQMRSIFPHQAIALETPVVVLQSDDWGLVGVRDAEGAEELRQNGIGRGSSPYDEYSLETAEDVSRLMSVLRKHRDATGRAACMVFNFITANVDFVRAQAKGLSADTLIALGQGFPAGWERPGLLEAYREGIGEGVIYPALHGLTHFNLKAAKRLLASDSLEGRHLRTLYASGTPQLPELHAQLGFEYLDPREGKGEWLDLPAQRQLIALGAKYFTEAFGLRPRSACAPGYRANPATRQAWLENCITVAQNGPGAERLPYQEPSGLWMLYRTVELEPANHPDWSDARIERQAERAVAYGAPIIVSMHSVNFHSTLQNYRDEALLRLDRFLGFLERRFPNLRYAHDEDLVARFEAGVRGAGTLQATKIRRRWELPARFQKRMLET